MIRLAGKGISSAGYFVFVVFLNSGFSLAQGKRPVNKPGPDSKEIALYYFNRPPYYFTGKNNTPKGLLLKPVLKQLANAPINIVAKEIPSDAVLGRLRANKGRECGIGWFKNPDREKFARFTNAIYTNKPLVILTTLKKKDSFQDLKTLEEIFRSALVWGHVENYSYGEYVDNMVAKAKPKKAASNDQKHMIKMMVGGRFDYMLIAPEESEVFISNSGFDKNDFFLFSPDGMPHGNSRYILCSRKVEESEIAVLNKFLRKIN